MDLTYKRYIFKFNLDPLESDDITNHIEPLISSSQNNWVNSVLDRILPDLKSSLDAEYDREKNDLEQEHKSRLQTLHAQHHHVHFELYEKNVQVQEQVHRLEEELEAKNRTISNFGKWYVF